MCVLQILSSEQFVETDFVRHFFKMAARAAVARGRKLNCKLTLNYYRVF